MKTVMLKLVLAFSLVVAFLTTANADNPYLYLYVAPNVPDGALNMRDGPGIHHALVGIVPASVPVIATRCVKRDDGIVGADWCLIGYNGLSGWASRAWMLTEYAAKRSPGFEPPRVDDGFFDEAKAHAAYEQCMLNPGMPHIEMIERRQLCAIYGAAKGSVKN